MSSSYLRQSFLHSQYKVSINEFCTFNPSASYITLWVLSTEVEQGSSYQQYLSVFLSIPQVPLLVLQTYFITALALFDITKIVFLTACST